MPELIGAYQREIANITTFWNSEWFNISSSKYLVFTVFCNRDFEMGIRWSVDDNLVVIDTDLEILTAMTMNTIQIPVKTRFAQLFVQNIASTPNNLQTQAFFFLDK